MALDLLFKIKADSSDARRDITSLRSTVQKEIAAVTGSSGFGGIASVATVAAAGIAAVGGAAIAAGTAIFNLAKQSSDYGSEIFDASQKTGLSTVSLSALKLAADQSGASLSDVTRATTLLSRTIADAARGSDEAAAKLKRLGIDPKEAIKDLDGTLSKVFRTINDAKTPIEQTAAATDAFGKSGAALIPVIKSFDGDMAALVKRAKELGLALSEEDARAADEFGDTLDTLTAQAKGVAFTFVRQFTPDLTRSMAAVSLAMQQNQSVAVQWGQEFGRVMRGSAVILDTFVGKAIYDYARISSAYLTGVGLLAKGLSLLGGGAPAPSPGYTGPPVPVPRSALLTREDFAAGPVASPYNVTGGGKDGGGGGGKGKSEAQAGEQKENENHYAELERDLKVHIDNLQREYERNLIGLGEYYKTRNAQSAQSFQLELQRLDAEEELARRYIKNQADLNIKLDELDLKRRQATDKRDEELQGLNDRLNDERSQAKVKHAHDLLSLHEIQRDAEITLVKETAERGVITESEAQTRIIEIRAAAWEEKKKLLLADIELAGQNQVKQQAALDALRIATAEYTAEFEEMSRRRREAIDAEIAAHLQLGLVSPELTEEQKRGNLIPEEELGPPPALTKHLDALRILKQVGGDAFKSLAAGMGQLVNNWVLLGNASGTSMKKIIATVLAGVAAQAAVQAVYEFAIGLAALTPWGFAIYGPASLHFQAAALLGSIALGAGIVGRAVAGSSLSGDARNEAGAPTGSQLSAQDRGTDTRTEERGNFDRGRQILHVILEPRSNEAHTLRVVEAGFRSPGPFRDSLVEVTGG